MLEDVAIINLHRKAFKQCVPSFKEQFELLPFVRDTEKHDREMSKIHIKINI